MAGEERLSITVAPNKAVSAVRHVGPGHAPWLVVYAPGAGSSLDDPFGAYLAERLADAGLASVRFQFPYMERGERRPDPEPVLLAAWRAVVDAVRVPGGRLAVGGRSMGGRMASMAVARGMAVDALVLFAYPLHPPGDAGNLRVGHLADIRVPTLFASGTRDAFGAPEELRQAAARVPQATLHLMEAADHGYAALKASGRSRQDVWQEAADVFVGWLGAV